MHLEALLRNRGENQILILSVMIAGGEIATFIADVNRPSLH